MQIALSVAAAWRKVRHKKKDFRSTPNKYNTAAPTPSDMEVSQNICKSNAEAESSPWNI